MALLLVSLAGFLLEYQGGNGVIPTWAQLYAAAGLRRTAPDPAFLEETDTSVSFLDIGQGDAVLICQDGEYCLIDAGPEESANLLLSALKEAGVQTLRLMVLTHPHADHIGGMITVLDNFTVEQLVIPAETNAEETYYNEARMRRAAQEHGVPITQAARGDVYAVGEGTLTVLFTGIQTSAASTDDAVNDTSLCLRFDAGEFSFVDTGDAEADEEAALLQSGASLEAQLLKAGHHGSSTSTTQPFLEAVDPKAVCASCGQDNDYGHPHRELIARVEEAGAAFYRTDQDGTVTFALQKDGALLVSCTANGGTYRLAA